MKYRHLDRVAKLIMDFNVHVMRAVDRERPDTSCELLCHQMVRVMLAAGASYRWGRRASNKREFVNRLRVSHAEFVECIFWLERVRVLRPNPVWEQELAVAKQIDSILVASLKKARGSKPDADGGSVAKRQDPHPGPPPLKEAIEPPIEDNKDPQDE